MSKAIKRLAAVGVMGVLAAGVVFAGSPAKVDLGSSHEIMVPGRGLSLDIGGKHAVGYFETKDQSCHLTVVVADVTGGESGLDSPGTRFVVPVVPGKGVQVDASAGQSAEFFCGPGATRMNARVFDRAPYKS
ncbi:hypothetical protein [Hyphomicrobium sp. LHD-15]|uniref:hypothetical protein n=1 Tax=Hyphomicrobium sp. LHD-15 TaxID=3072142 RepID=UPI0028108FBF|nr:hypothetical protein [Hyphomicrobium sp. LHD-15]MDQ8697148.1 hypothetical protein [Hyphomicrobium sp. LHD-15]